MKYFSCRLKYLGYYCVSRASVVTLMSIMLQYFDVFFFQAEDGIRDKLVTGVACYYREQNNCRTHCSRY